MAAKIWYRALTVYMTSETNYKQARNATLFAAQDLVRGWPIGAAFGVVLTLNAAWDAVGVPETP